MKKPLLPGLGGRPFVPPPPLAGSSFARDLLGRENEASPLLGTEAPKKKDPKFRRVADDDTIDLHSPDGRPVKLHVRKRVVLHDLIMEQAAAPLRYLRKAAPNNFKTLKGRDLYAKLYARFAYEVARAPKFVLDNSALETVIRAATVGDKRKIEGMLYLARLPYPSMWVEFDGFQRNKIQKALGTSAPEVDPDGGPISQVGFLLRRVSLHDECLWTAMHAGHNITKGMDYVDHGGAGVMICNDGRPLPDTEEDNEALRWNDMSIIPISQHWGEDEIRAMHAFQWGLVDGRGTRMPVVTDVLARGARAMMPGIAYALQRGDDKNPAETATKRLMENILDSRGDARFLVALLSMINRVPMKKVIREGGAPRMIRDRHVKYHAHTVISIDLAKTVAVDRIIKAAAVQRKRHHDVRGHWRKEPGVIGPSCRPGQHLPIPNPRDHEEMLCRRCHLKMVWIPEHERGDKNLGTVSHTYEIRSSSRGG